MDNDLLERASELNRAGAAFVLATVVRAEKPTSAKPGANAIITGNGRLTGWVGGSCTERTVLSQAREALRDGQPRLVRLSPPEKLGVAPQDGVIEVALTCASGGTLDIYIEPHLPRPHLVVIGHLPVALSLARLGRGVGYEVSVMGPDLPAADDGRWTMDDGGKATGSQAPSSIVDGLSSGAARVHVFNSLDFSQVKVTPQTY